MGVLTAESTSIRKSNSLEGDIAEYGQKNISTLKRNLQNIDEIMRQPQDKITSLLRGHNPLSLDKVFYKEHPLAKKLKPCSIYDYNPSWTKNTTQTIIKPKKEQKKVKKKIQKMSFDTF